jgi:hypothetical protein
MFDTARPNVTIDHAVQHAEHQAVGTYTDIVAVNAYTRNLRQVVRTTSTWSPAPELSHRMLYLSARIPPDFKFPKSTH